VTASTRTSVTCTTGPYLNSTPTPATTPSSFLPANPISTQLAVAASLGANFQSYSSLTFSYSSSLTPWVASLDRTRGSTEGGTVLNFNISNFDLVTASQVTIRLGSASLGLVCGSVSISGDKSVLTCTTPNPPRPKPIGPLAVTVLVDGMGAAAGEN
jgi:hypothetical protein